MIPRGKMTLIYADMLLADQWLEQHPAYRKQADTTFFYDPVFRRYGYTAADYRKSVDYYMKDPKRYGRMLTRTSEVLDERITVLQRQYKAEEAVRTEKERIHNLDFGVRYYKDVYVGKIRVDTIGVWVDSLHVLHVEPVAEETLFKGPVILKEVEDE